VFSDDLGSGPRWLCGARIPATGRSVCALTSIRIAGTGIEFSSAVGVEFSFGGGVDFTTGAESISGERADGTVAFRIVALGILALGILAFGLVAFGSVAPNVPGGGAGVEFSFAGGADFTIGAEGTSNETTGETAGCGIVTPNAIGAAGAGDNAWISCTSVLAG
jgi:hypothetical protein